MQTHDAKRLKLSADKHGYQKEASTATNGIFNGMFIYILPAGIGKGRLNLFKDRIVNNGGQILDDWTDGRLTHIVVDNGVSSDRLQKLLEIGVEMKKDTELLQSKTNKKQYVKISWLSDCLKTKNCLNVKDYVLDINVLTTTKDLPDKNAPGSSRSVEGEGRGTVLVSNNRQHGGNKITVDDTADGCSVLTSEELLNAKGSKATRRTLNKSKFICAVSSHEHPVNHNQHITEKLEALATTFKSTKDHWRALGYERAVSVLKNHSKEVTTWEEARALPGIGERLADKIWEIIESGRLRKMEEVCSNEKIAALNIFMNIWGVGATTAQLLVQQGCRTLNDVMDKADLNRQQKIGLKYYHEFLERMPREEAAEIEAVVKSTALNLQSGLEVVACGSYRRGKATCGDVDVLITHSDGKSHQGLLPRLLSALHQSGFLTDDLVANEVSGNQHKYLGVCKLPGESNKHRRLDIIIVPYSEFACSLLYFTGSAHFNRSMRLLARKMNMGLSEHSLNAGVVRKVNNMTY